MKVGDLVKCIWQPGCSGIKDGSAMPMVYHIKGEYGIIASQRLEVGHHTILFPEFGYQHTLSPGAFEVIDQ